LLFVPNLIWEIAHGWPTVEFMRNAERFKNYHPLPIVFVLGQAVMTGPLSVPLWLAGLWWYLGSSEGRWLRAIGWTYLTILIVFAIQGAKDYYLAPAYPTLFAAGAVAFESWFVGAKMRWLQVAYPVLLVLSAAMIAPLVMPILPPQKLVQYRRRFSITSVPTERGKEKIALLPQHFADRFGWRQKVEAVATVYAAIGPDERAHTAIAAGNYGEAGAIDFFGPQFQLPHAYSTHNSYWTWGPPPDSTRTLIAIGISRSDLENLCASVSVATVVRCPFCMPYENDLPIFVCHDLKVTPSQVWPGAKHYI
jgi:hypothetical protein